MECDLSRDLLISSELQTAGTRWKFIRGSVMSETFESSENSDDDGVVGGSGYADSG
jgi:hypothetical protein